MAHIPGGKKQSPSLKSNAKYRLSYIDSPCRVVDALSVTHFATAYSKHFAYISLSADCQPAASSPRDNAIVPELFLASPMGMYFKINDFAFI